MKTYLQFLKEHTSDGIPIKAKMISIFTNNDKIDFFVEISETPKEKEIGLMYRKYMPDDQGMIFIENRERRVSYWMKNTYIPLDIIFINSDLEIINIYKNAEPESLDRIYSVKPVKYILEINGGLCDKLNIRIGNRLEI